MATVYRAYDPSFERDVALKILKRELLEDSQLRERFERETKIVAKLEHAAIVPVYDVGFDNNQLFYVMRYMPGGSLTERIENGRLGIEQIARLKTGSVVVGFMQPHARHAEVRALRDRTITSFAMELVPRISRGEPFGRTLVMALGIWAFGHFLVMTLLRRAARQRILAMQRALPDSLDLMVVCVEAGLGINASLKRVAEDFRTTHPILSAEFELANFETRAGKSTTDALRAAMLELMDAGATRDGRGQLAYTYAHPMFWAPFVLVGDGG